MKTTSFALSLLVAMAAVACADRHNFHVEGATSGSVDYKQLVVYTADEDFEYSDSMADTVEVVGHKFRFACQIIRPCFISIRSLDEELIFNLVATPDESALVAIDVNGSDVVAGSSFYTEWANYSRLFKTHADSVRSFQRQLIANNKKDTALHASLVDKYLKARASLDSCTRQNNKSEGAVVFARLVKERDADLLFDSLNTDIREGRFKAMFDTLESHYIRQNELYSKHESIIAITKLTTVEGCAFADFQAEYEGRVQRLSDYVGKGQYVLAVFWASWCMPCRMEIPALNNLYNKYKDHNLIVLGIPSRDVPRDTKKVMKEFGISYPQIMNAQYEGMNAYGLDVIPHIILFGPDGTILRRGLRAENIEAVIEECVHISPK